MACPRSVFLAGPLDLLPFVGGDAVKLLLSQPLGILFWWLFLNFDLLFHGLNLRFCDHWAHFDPVHIIYFLPIEAPNHIEIGVCIHHRLVKGAFGRSVSNGDDP
jgi:hypothetical protein